LHAATPGSVEVLKIPGNRSELIFKLKTAEKPFALIKIGDISGWLKDKLVGYEINESFENESYFRRINSDDSDVNILMGSRAFYEGWDSNRPNIILFVNIGMGSDAKKFVLQSVGRGVRIEPQKHRRKRLQSLFNAGAVSEHLFEKVKNLILPMESLFIFGTNAENLKEVIKTLKGEEQDIILSEAFIVNPEAQKHLLLIPVYKTAEKIFAEEKEPQKYPLTRNDFDITAKYYELLGDKVVLAKYDCDVKVLKKAKKSIKEENGYRYYTLEKDEVSLLEPGLILGRILSYLGVKSKELDKFKELENEIVHFKKVRFADKDRCEEIKGKIKEIRRFPERQKELDKLYGKISRKEYEKWLNLFEEAGNFEIENKKIKIKYLANHYYLPVVVSETEKIDYLNHIINVDSEVKFIEWLEEYIGRPNNILSQFDWWMFSKLDHTQDEIYIPYYSSRENNIAKFKPDFIFWMQKGERYLVLFVDPKGTEHADAYKKIDGYRRIFESNDAVKNFSFDGCLVNVKLLLKPPKGLAAVPDEYKKYWFDSFEDFDKKLQTEL
jgi:type III restriction enzyme